MSGTRDSSSIEAMVDGWLGETDNGQQPPADNQGVETNETDPPADQTEDTSSQSAKPDAVEAQPNVAPGKPADDKNRVVEQAPKAGPGDLVDREGRVLAKAGAERRHYEAAQRATRDVQSVRQQLQQRDAELAAFREAAQLPTQLGLSPEESSTGLQLAHSWKNNPVGVIQYLVEQAKAAGHTLDGIGGMADPGAIKRMIAEEMAPFRQQATQLQSQTEANTAAQQQIDGLVSAYGNEAMVNAEALSKLIGAAAEAGSPMNLEQAYGRFTNWCIQNGYDPRNPIDPQIAAKQQPTPPATQQSQPPRPNGRAVAAPNGVIPMDTAANITGNETTRDLVRIAMREQGFNV